MAEFSLWEGRKCTNHSEPKTKVRGCLQNVKCKLIVPLNYIVFGITRSRKGKIAIKIPSIGQPCVNTVLKCNCRRRGRGLAHQQLAVCPLGCPAPGDGGVGEGVVAVLLSSPWCQRRVKTTPSSCDCGRCRSSAIPNSNWWPPAVPTVAMTLFCFMFRPTGSSV